MEGIQGEFGGRELPASSTTSSSVFKSELVCVNENTYQVYVSGQPPPVETEGSQKKPPILLLIHGGGHTGLSFTLSVKELTRLMPSCCILAPDLRGHGETSTRDDDDLSMPRLVDDLLAVLSWAVGGSASSSSSSSSNVPYSGGDPPRLVLVGHSLGGAIAIRAAADPRISALATLAGLVVVDMVEGSALASLDYMRSALQAIPKQFDTVEQAVQWSVGHGVIKNLESAKISVPAQLRVNEVDGLASGYVWRTDLLLSEKYWRAWFSGLSELFLSAVCPRLLVLATWDRIDTTLMKAQMAGKFEVQVVNGSNHAVHEDFPDAFARILFRFLCRNGFSDEAQMAALQARLAQAKADYRLSPPSPQARQSPGPGISPPRS